MNHDPDLKKFQDHAFAVVPEWATGLAKRAPEAFPGATGHVM